MESNNSVGKVGVQAHTGSKSDRQVGEQPHAEGTKGGDSGGGSDNVALNLLNTLEILDIVNTKVGHALWRAHTGTTAVGDDGRVDRNDVSHSEKGGKTGADFSGEERSFAFLVLETLDDAPLEVCAWMMIVAATRLDSTV